MSGWIPSRDQKRWAELLLWPIIQSFQLLTSWKLAWTWSFLLAYLIGQPIGFCIAASLVVTTAAWYLWRDYGDSDVKD